MVEVFTIFSCISGQARTLIKRRWCAPQLRQTEPVAGPPRTTVGRRGLGRHTRWWVVVQSGERGCSSMPGARWYGAAFVLGGAGALVLWKGCLVLLLLDASPLGLLHVCPAVTEDARNLAFGSAGHSLLACFSPPCFSMCCTAAPTNVSSVALSETSPTHATNRTGKYQPRHPGGAGTTPRSVSPLHHLISPAPSHLVSHLCTLRKDVQPALQNAPGFLHTCCLG